MFAYSNVGTPYYMSPEQVDENKYNEKSDIWSLGCFLYELTALHPPFEAHNYLSLALKIKSGKVDKLPDKYSDNLCKVIFWMMNVDQEKRPTIKDLIMIPEVNIRIKERKIKEGYQKLKKYENELKIKEESLVEKEKKLKMKEKFLDEREKNIIQRENYIKMKEEGNDNIKYKNNYNLFITSRGFDIKGSDNLNEKNNEDNNTNLKYDLKHHTIKNAPITNYKKFFNIQNVGSMNELMPINIDKRYATTIRRSINEDKNQYDFDKNKVLNNKENSLYTNKLKTNIDISINNNNSLKNILTSHYNTSKININSINFNNSNNSLTKINSNKNIIDGHSKVISFNSDNYSTNDEKVIKNNNINSKSLGFLSINSQENILLHNNSNNNISNSIRNNSVYNNRHSSSNNNHFNENNKNSLADNNMDYKSGSTNYFSSIPRTSGDSYNEKINNNERINNSENIMNRNYNSFNVKNIKANENKGSLNINNYTDNYRLQRNEKLINHSKKSKQILNIEYNKKYASEEYIDEYNKNESKRNNQNYHNKYTPNNFRNYSHGKKTKINNKDEQNNNEKSLNIKCIRRQNNHNIPRKKYTSSKSTNSINIINFNNINENENSKLSPETFRFDENYEAYRKNGNILRKRKGKIHDKYYKNEFIEYDENNHNNYYKQKKKFKNINYYSNRNNLNKEILIKKNKNYNNDNMDMKRKTKELDTNRYINTINNK